MKANSNQAVIATLAALGAGMDVVCEGELRRARAAGVPGSGSSSPASARPKAEMTLGLDEEILCFNVESEPELEALSAVASARGAARADRHSRQSRRRRAHPRQDRDRQVGEQVRRADLARPRGLRPRPRPARPRDPRRRHAYRLADHRPRAVRQRLRPASPTSCGLCAPTATRSIMSISAAASASPTAPTTIPRPSRRPMPRSSPATRARSAARSILEPGRLIVGNAGVLVASVIYVKTGESKSFVIVDAAMNDLVRPTLYDAYHDILPVQAPTPRAARFARDVVGPVCESGDLSRARPRHCPRSPRATSSR